MEHRSSDYVSGDDFVVEFLDYRYGFSRFDFEQRVTAAAARLRAGAPTRVAAGGDRRPGRRLAATGIHRAAAERTWARTSTSHLAEIDRLHPEPLSYWLRKLVFRGAWLDHRVKTGMLDVSFDQESGIFGYRMPTDTSPLVELAPVPSWAALRYPG